MRLLFVVDGRSPIALNWIEHFVAEGHAVHVVSTYAAHIRLPLDSLHVLALPFGRESEGGSRPKAPGSKRSLRLGNFARRLVPAGARTAIRQRLIPLALPRLARGLSEIIAGVQPDLVHAMRIPYEGMLAALALQQRPAQTRLLLSVWGNDFTLHAPATRRLGQLTAFSLRMADALHADCARDLRLAHAWQFPAGRPQIVLPGSGGVQEELFFPLPEQAVDGLPMTVVNPRGMRAYVRNEAFFRAIPLVLAKFPQAQFVCPTMAGEAQARRWVDELGIAPNVQLLGHLTRAEMAELFRRAQVTVSPSIHDGTPNTLLEAMACGSFPVAGDLESIREWITPGVNGLLANPNSPEDLAYWMTLAIEQAGLRRRARSLNLALIQQRAAYRQVMHLAGEFYEQILG